jgi:hypothetical protein
MDSRYGLKYLAAHLEGAGRAPDLHRLLSLERRDDHWWGWLAHLLSRRNAPKITDHATNTWYRAKENAGDTAGYLADIGRAWRLAEGAYDPTQTIETGYVIGLQCRYALITSSLTSTAEKIPPALLIALVAQGVWEPVQGWVYARQIPDIEQRVEAVSGLAPYLPETLLPEALALAREQLHLYPWHQVGVLTALIPHLPEAEQSTVLLRSLALTHLPAPMGRAEALARLLPHLPEVERSEALGEALTAARAIEQERAQTLAELGPHLSEAQRAQITLEASVLASTKPRALAKLIPYLPEAERNPILREALTAAQALEEEIERREALVGVVSCLPETERSEALRAALAAARALTDEWDRAEALVGLAPTLAELGHPAEALELVRSGRTYGTGRKG